MSSLLLFGLGVLDGGGPFVRRSRGVYGSRTFLFPQTQIEQSERSAAGVGAKLLNMVQSLISLTIVVVVFSRAVGVL